MKPTPRPKPYAKGLQQRLLDAKRAGWRAWIRSEADERALLEGCTFDVAAAERVRDFFPDLLVHSKGKAFAGQPFHLLDWQYRDLLGPIFGWKRANRSRRYRRAYVEIPKKNGKSTIASGVSLYLLVGDGEPGAHVFSCAADLDQAGLVYDEAANMAEASPELSAILKVRRATKLILYPDKRSKYEAIAADADSAEGKDAHGLVCDELHVWRGRQFFESLKYAGRAREQPLIFMITTAGDDMTSVCYEEHEKALRVIKGEEIDSSYFGYVAAAAPTDDWKDPATWQKANPSFGVTINAESFADDVRDAAGSPTKENAFKRYSLDIWIGASAAWISLDAWQACGEVFEEEDLHGLPAWPGIDLSRTRDLSAVVWTIPVEDEFFWIPRLYMPEGVIDRKEKEDKVPYRSWIQMGLIRATPGDVVDYAAIRRDFLADADNFDVQQVRFDPYNAETFCNQQLRLEDGFDTVAVGQTMANMGPVSTSFEALVKQQKIRHGGHVVLAWMMSGCVVYMDTNGNIRPIKRKSRTRIDGIVAGLLGLSGCLTAEGIVGSSYYDDHEVELI